MMVVNDRAGWTEYTMESVADVIDPHPSHRAPPESKSGIPFPGIGDFRENGEIDLKSCRQVDFRVFEEHKKRYMVEEGDIGFGRVASIGKVIRLDPAYLPFALSPTIALLKPKAIDTGYLRQYLQSPDITEQIAKLLTGTTRSSLGIELLRKLRINAPSKPEQAKIAENLSTVDRAIEQTEALIAKQQRIKTGLMQDLLTRGIDEHGNLRSEETHKFKDSPLGRIPVEWKGEELGKLVASAVDGPFGSNLKTEHYVDEPGVRVIRLQNVGNGEFIDSDKAWISKEHAKRLERHSVLSGDMLVGSLGDDKRLFGRACLYPNTQDPAIVKADVFCIRCKSDVMVNEFAFRLLNLPRWRSGLFGLAQGVTRNRVNLTNLLNLQLPVPKKEEQQRTASILDAEDQVIIRMQANLSKLTTLKTALMQDLLTPGKVPVTPLLTEPQEAST